MFLGRVTYCVGRYGGTMNKYITYEQLAKELSCTKRTIERKIATMSITKRYLGGSGKPYFLVLDWHSNMLFNKSFKQCTQLEKIEVRDLLN